MKSYFGGLLCCCWSADGRYIATGGEDDFITVFSFLEQRVACRGRGHNSWINACTFDEWTCLSEKPNRGGKANKSRAENKKSDKTNDLVRYSSSFGNFIYTIIIFLHKYKDNEQQDPSDLEDFVTNQSKLKKLNLNQESMKSPTASSSPHSTVQQTKRHAITKKNRTISTLSDFNYSNLDQNNINGSSIYYRLASCGQDNQICFWDLTEDVLKERPTNNNRTRLTSLNAAQSSNHKSKSMAAADLPKINVQANESAGKSGDLMKSKSSTKSSHSSLVSTARNLFSLKHSETGKAKSSSKNKLEYSPGDQAEMEQQQNYKSLGHASSSSGFFKKVGCNSELYWHWNKI